MSSLVGANLAWVRTDFGPMDDLLADVKKHGVRQPVLIQPDYLCLDGARRLVAAAKTKQTYVPVIICHTWEQLQEHFSPFAPGAYPMTWMEIRDLATRVLRPIYQEYRYRRTTARKDEMAAVGLERSGKREYSYSGFTMAVAQLFGAQPVHVKMLHDNIKRLYDYQATEPDLVKGLTELITTLPPEHRQKFASIRILKAVLDRHRDGASVAETVAFMDAQIATLTGAEGATFVPRKKSKLDPAAPPVPLGVIRNWAEMLETVCQQADGFRNFNLHTQHQIDEFIKQFERVTIANGRLYRLRRRMESAIPQDQIPGTETRSLPE